MTLKKEAKKSIDRDGLLLFSKGTVAMLGAAERCDCDICVWHANEVANATQALLTHYKHAHSTAKIKCLK